MRSIKKYVEISYLGENKIVPVYQYVCYVSSYDMDAMELHELYKQRSASETWIEQVKVGNSPNEQKHTDYLSRGVNHFGRN